MRIATKLYIGFSFVIVLAILVGMFGIIGMIRLRESGLAMYEKQVIGLEYMAKAADELKKARLECRQVVLSSLYDDPKGAEDSKQAFEKSVAAFESWMTSCKDIRTTDEMKRFHDVTMKLFYESYMPTTNQIMEASIADMPDHVNKLEINVLIASTVEPIRQIEQLLRGMMELESALAKQTSDQNAELTRTLIVLQCVLLGIAVIVTLLVGTYITRSIVVPIKESIMVLNKITTGDFSARVQGNYRGDMAMIKEAVNATAMGLTSYLNDKLRAEHAQGVTETAMEARMFFLANMSHEIRTPMNGIIGLTELALTDKNITYKTADYLTKINSSATGLLSIINDILDFSKIDAHEIMLENIPFDLYQVFSECEAIISHKAEEKGLMFYIYYENKILKKLMGDPTKLRQALLNLLSNSIKFTEKGSVTLLAKVIEGSESDQTVSIYFEVKDTGIGISKEQRVSIFEPFKQADDSTTRHYGGTGLGLAITKTIITMMGGTIEIDSVQSVGSKFYFTIPFEFSEELCDPTQRTADVSMNVSQPLFAGEVLVCEDNRINQQVAREHLERVGFQVTIAENGKIGVDQVRKRKEQNKPFELIFMDIHMPIMDGLQATRQILEMGTTIPIIAMTANAMTEDREKCLKYGMKGYISKPFKPQQLWTLLLQYINPIEMVPDNVAKIEHRLTEVIDREIGIANCAYNEKLYEKLLLDFVRDQPLVFETLKQTVADEDYTQAHRIAHTLKSVAATIGAHSLSEKCKILEGMFLNGERENKRMLEECEEEMQRVLERIGGLQLQPEATQASLVLDNAKVLVFLEELAPLVEKGQTLSDEQTEYLGTLVSYNAHYEELREHIENYDFDLAMETLIEIRKELEEQ